MPRLPEACTITCCFIPCDRRAVYVYFLGPEEKDPYADTYVCEEHKLDMEALSEAEEAE